MEPGNEIRTARIVYFSGTGGARRIAQAFHKGLAERGIKAECTALEGKAVREGNQGPADLLLLIFAVHAFDAPMPVYTWINEMKPAAGKAAVISVSGGGETWPNTGCRNRVCGALEEKGYEVVYDGMMVMPCNWVVPVSDHAAMWMLRAIPGKVKGVLDDVLAGKVRRTRFKMGFLRTLVTRQEKKNGHRVGQEFTINSDCTGCGWCARSCPAGNITIMDGRPCIGDKCILCFRCIYGCPSRAIQSTNFMVLKGGFDLDALEKRMQGVDLMPVEQCLKGLAWKSVRGYLMNEKGY